jgi:hypothetical protein
MNNYYLLSFLLLCFPHYNTEIYNSIKDYKEDFDQDLASAGSLIRWIIGNNGFTRQVVFLPGKTELMEKIEKFKDETFIKSTTREEKPLTEEITL